MTSDKPLTTYKGYHLHLNFVFSAHLSFITLYCLRTVWVSKWAVSSIHWPMRSSAYTKDHMENLATKPYADWGRHSIIIKQLKNREGQIVHSNYNRQVLHGYTHQHEEGSALHSHPS